MIMGGRLLGTFSRKTQATTTPEEPKSHEWSNESGAEGVQWTSYRHFSPIRALQHMGSAPKKGMSTAKLAGNG